MKESVHRRTRRDLLLDCLGLKLKLAETQEEQLALWGAQVKVHTDEGRAKDGLARFIHFQNCENCVTERRRRQKAVYSRRWRDAKHLCGMPPADWYVENPDLPDLWLCGTPDHAVCALCGEEGLVALSRFPAFYTMVCSPLRPDSRSGHFIST